MRQKGGSFTIEGTGKTVTAEQLLDKFSETYFEKHSITIPSDIYDIIYSYLHVGENEGLSPYDQNSAFWFKRIDTNFEDQYLIEDKYLNYDDIEKLIWNRLKIKTPRRNSRTPAVIHFPKPTYVFQFSEKGDNKIITGPLIEAYHPFIRSLPGEPGIWTFCYKDVNGNEIITTKKYSGTPQDVIFALTNDAKGNGDTQSRISGDTPPNSGIPISNVSKYSHDIYESHPKLIYRYENSQLRIHYAEARSENEWVFHPHNMVNLLPPIKKQKRLKKLFEIIKDKMNATNVPTNPDVNLLPDSFFHIHVAYIPKEETICLTIHGLTEFGWKTSKEENTYSDYFYENETGQTRTGQKKTIDVVSGSLENIEIPVGNERRIYQNYRRGHNAYILLKPRTDNHPIYKISDKNQMGNPFLMPSFRFKAQGKNMERDFGIPYRYFNSYALDGSSIGLVKFNINHIQNKGIILAPANPNCLAFCNSDTGRQDYPGIKQNISKFFIGNSSPLQEEELGEWRSLVRSVVTPTEPGRSTTLNSFRFSRPTAPARNQNTRRNLLRRIRRLRKTRKY